MLQNLITFNLIPLGRRDNLISSLNFCHAGCRNVKKFGKVLSCNEDETVVKCHGSGSDGCRGDQTSDGKGCKINGCDFGDLNESSLTIEAICCKEATNIYDG